MKACVPGGIYDQEMQNDSGTVVSAKGQLPCPFLAFEKMEAPQKVQRRLNRTLPQLVDMEPEPEGETDSTSGTTSGATANTVPRMECRCGAIPMSEIEAVLLDPRNNSYQYWRHRQPDVILKSHENTNIALKSVNEPDSDLPPGWTIEHDEISHQEIYLNSSTGEVLFERPSLNVGWSREAELLGRGFTPANVHETARLRVAIAEASAVAAELKELEEKRKKSMDPAEIALAELKVQVIEALDRGGSVLCPRCGTRMIKDDACIHIDSCACGAHWCFLCAKESCPRGGGGCDEVSYYLQSHPGWEAFNLDGETPSRGAQQEFYRQRQAFMVRAVMELTPPDLWASLRKKYPGLLADTPTRGRNIEWDSLESAEEPLFGANLRRRQAEDARDPGAAKRRVQRYWETIRLEEMAPALREARRWRHQVCCFPTVAIIVALLFVGTHLLFRHYPPPNPAIPIFYNESDLNSTAGATGTADGLVFEPDLIEPVNDTANVTQTTPFEPPEFDDATFPVQFTKWLPIVLLVLGWTPLLLGACIKHVGDTNVEWVQMDAYMFSLANLSLFWHVFVQGEQILESSWFVAYMWRPFCVFCNSGWVSILYAVIQDVDDPFVICSACGTLALTVTSIICTAITRHAYDIHPSDPCYTLSAGEAVPAEACQDVFTECAAGIAAGFCEQFFCPTCALAGQCDKSCELCSNGDCVTSDPMAFDCTWGCTFVVWYPRVVFLVGAFMLCIAVLYWLKDRPEIPAHLLAPLGLVFAGAFFWPGTMDPATHLLDLNWFTAYMLSPFCTCMMGSGWLGVTILIMLEASGNDNGREERVMVPALGLSCISFVLWEVSFATFRKSNEDYASLPTADTEHEWTGATYWLYWGPLSLLLLGALEIVIAAGHSVFTRMQNNELPAILAMACASFIFPFWPVFLVNVEEYLTANWMMVYCALPACQGFLAAAWFASTTLFCYEQLRHQDVDDLINERTLMLVVSSFCVANVIAYYSAIVALRVGEPQEAAAYEPQEAAAYECTWPCFALRIFLSCCLGLAGAAGAMSVYSTQRDPVLHRCLKVLLCLLLLLLLGLFVLAVAEAVYEWPIEMPLKSLIHGPASWNYCWGPVLCVTTVGLGYRCLVSVMTPRCKLLSQMYDVSSILVAASGTGSAWLIYVLRHSADVTYREWELSRRSLMIFWQLIGTCYWGLVLVAYCWKTSAQQQPLWSHTDSRWLAGRTLLCWLPSTAWPLVLLAISGSDRDVLNEIHGKCPLAFVGLAIGVAGFVYEIITLMRVFSCRRRARLFVAVTSGFVVLLVNTWLLLGERCMSLWWRGLSERWWFLLQDVCEPI